MRAAVSGGNHCTQLKDDIRFNVGPLFHGTVHRFDSFDEAFFSLPDEEPGFFFSDVAEVATHSDYVGNHGFIIEVFVRAQNPYRVTELQWARQMGFAPSEAFDEGYDAYVIEGQDGGNTWMIPKASQIRIKRITQYSRPLALSNLHEGDDDDDDDDGRKNMRLS